MRDFMCLSIVSMADSIARARAVTSVTSIGGAALVAGILLTASTARASDTTWYGYQTLAVDGVSAGLIGVNAYLIKKDTEHGDTGDHTGVYVILAGLGGLGYLFGGPTVHWAHGRTGIGFADLGARVALPLAGLGIGALIPARDQTPGIIIGAIIGGCLAVALDAVVFARDPILGSSASSTSALTSQQRMRLFSLGGAF
jgi:hypothetical protein